MNNTKIATVGSVISGTMRKEDLIPDFIFELGELEHESDNLSEIITRFNESDKSYFKSEDSDFDLEELFDMMDEHSPEGYYFGAHPGDGSDYGFWMFEDYSDNEEDEEY
jgi:hypothetical protein